MLVKACVPSEDKGQLITLLSGLFMKSGGLHAKYALINSLDFKIRALSLDNRCLDSF